MGAILKFNFSIKKKKKNLKFIKFEKKKKKVKTFAMQF